MPTETLIRSESVTAEANGRLETTSRDEELRKIAIQHLEHVRRFKLYLTGYILSLLVLTPIWVVTQYEEDSTWLKHLSSRSRYPGDWDPWIIWVALVGGLVVTLAALRAYYFDRHATTEADIEREIERLKTH